MTGARRSRIERLAARFGAGLAALGMAAVLWRTAPFDPLRAARRYVKPPWPPRLPDGAIDWSGMDYVEVNNADYRFGARTLDALLEGPMKRLLDICDAETGIRGSARVMEFARGPVARFKTRHARSGEKARRVDEAVMAELERRFGGRGSDGRYLIDVYLGKRDHNG